MITINMRGECITTIKYCNVCLKYSKHFSLEVESGKVLYYNNLIQDKFLLPPDRIEAIQQKIN